MPSLSTLKPLALLYAPGVPDPILQGFLEQAAAEFCRDTWVCQETASLTDADGVFTAAAPSGMEVLGVLRLASNGRTIWSRWPEAADNVLGTIDVATRTTDQPVDFVIDQATVQVQMLPPTARAQDMNIRFAVAPVVGQDDVPASLLSSWQWAVVYKALELLLLQPAQAYTNAALSKEFQMRYAGERQRARIEVNRSLARHGTRMTGPRFGGR